MVFEIHWGIQANGRKYKEEKKGNHEIDERTRKKNGADPAQPPKIQPVVAGVAGGTASGKSTFCAALQRRMPRGAVVVLQLDSYYRCRADLPPSERERLNYDHPDALDVERMVEHLRELRRGRAVRVPVYDFSTHTRAAKTVEISSAPVILVEGILALHWKELREQYDLKIFLEAREDIRLHRRIARDRSERGRTRASVMNQWNDSVQPMSARYCDPTKKFSDLIVSGESPYDDILDDMVRRLAEL